MPAGWRENRRSTKLSDGRALPLVDQPSYSRQTPSKHPPTPLMKLSRRTMLRGSGAAIALPLLDAMSTARGDSPVKPPVRMGFLFFPNGMWRDAWVPKIADGQTSQSEFELPFSLEPLAPVRKDVLVLSGLDKANSRSGDGHYAKTANFLTGLTVVKTTGKEISTGGASIDQLCAKQIGHLTPLPSLELGIDPVISGIDSNVGYTRLYGSHISWETAERPVAKEINPRMVYERLFGDRGQPADAARREDDRSLLDLAYGDAKRLRARLGRDDQFKLDEYLDSIRAVERRIAFFSQPDPRGALPPEAIAAAKEGVPPPSDKPHDVQEHVRIMMDLMALALRTDSTRILSFMFANDVSGRNFSFVEGVRGSHHELSHHEKKADKIEQYKRIVRWHVEQFVYLTNKLKETREGDGTLLDHCMLVLGCGMSDGNSHDPNNLPILLAGRGGNSIAAGRHIASPANTPLCNLYVSMLERMGTPVESFGDSKGKLELA